MMPGSCEWFWLWLGSPMPRPPPPSARAPVQASPAELRAALRELGAVQLGRHWRLVEPAYMGGLLEVLLLT